MARYSKATSAAERETVRALGDGSNIPRGRDLAFKLVILACIVVAILTLAAVVVVAAIEGRGRLDLNLVRNVPSTLDRSTSGMATAIVGTAMLMVGVIVTVMPLGVSAAIYLEEYADGSKWWNRLIELNIQNLAAVPSIVFGILGLAFIVRGPLSLGPVVYAGSLTLALMVLPTVILASREAIRAVPPSIRHASMGLGATKWQTIRRQVLPSAVPGIITGAILSLSRAIGETAPLLLVGATTFVLSNPQGFFDGRYTAIPVLIYQWFARAQADFRVLAAAGIIVLMAVLLLMNSGAIWLRNKYTRDW
jgi:phosphate transport system permease protein